MKRPTLSLLACSLILAGSALSGCGGEEPAKVDPNDVLNRAFADAGTGAAPETGAEVTVSSLGTEDNTLASRKVSVNPNTYAAISEAIASPERGLEAVVADIEYEGTEEIDGVEVDHVSGRLDVPELVDSLTAASNSGDDLGEEGAGLPSLSELRRLSETLADGRFDLYAGSGEGAFERLDLTLSLDDRENALPPTRIRFSLTESDPNEESS